MASYAKVGIIGASHVGAHVANAILAQGLAGEIHLSDKNEALCLAQVNDLVDAMPFYPHRCKVVGHDARYEELAQCDVIVNAAGNVAAVAGGRDGELFVTTDECRTFAQRIVDAGFTGIWVSVANPNDVVAHEFAHLTGYDTRKVIGSGCTVDSARLRHALADETGVDPSSVNAYMLGEHGFSEFALWSQASIGGLSLERFEEQRGLSLDRADLEERALRGGFVTYSGKQCTEYSIANATVEIVKAVLFDTKSITPVSTLIQDIYGESGVFASLPCIIGSEGIEGVLVPEFSPEEIEKWHATCEHIRGNIAQLSWW